MPGSVLLIDSDIGFTNEARAILEFLDRPVVVSNCANGRFPHPLSADQFKAVMLRFQPASDQIATLLGNIHRFAPALPIIVVHDRQSGIQSLPDSPQIIGELEWPIRQRDLLALLAEVDAAYALREKTAGKAEQSQQQGLVGSGRAMQTVRQLIAQVANSPSTVLIQGASGTGKEVVAKAIHAQSARARQAFVPINCGAIPAELLESELFGHEKGAFTGAINARRGRFEMADGGTLFLDEIGDMSLDMQVKLLRVLQERTFERVGSNKPIKANVRIIAATHRNLEHLVSEGRFRLDLFYRLNVFPIEVPSLGGRREDIPELVSFFIRHLEEEGLPSISLAPSALAALGSYSWPGNVRELSNLIERLSLLYPGKAIGWRDLPARYRANEDWVAEVEDISSAYEPFADAASGVSMDHAAPGLPEEGIDLKSYLREVEIGLIQEALARSDGVVTKAAKLLNLQRTTLVEKIRKLQIDRIDSASNI